MVKIDFKTPYFDYDVTLIQIEGSKDALEVCKYLTKNDINKEVVDDVKEKIVGGYVNGGETNWNTKTKRIICVFYEYLEDSAKANVYSHEKRHIEDRILQHCGVDDIETSGYFAGYLGEIFYEFWNKTNK